MHSIPNNLPTKPWIYLFKNKKGEILYIGKGKNILKRIQQYFSPNSVRKQDMVNQADHIDYIVTETETEALELEDNLVKEHKPPFNSLLRENNYYVYIKIPKEDFPNIFIVRKRKNDGANYIGPKYHSKELRNFLQFFRQLLKYRGCKKTQFRQGKLCSDYYFWLCKGRCNLNVIAKDSVISSEVKKSLSTKKKETELDQAKRQYHRITSSIQKFFEGNTSKIEQTIKDEIQSAIQKQHFERAAKLRDMLLHIDKITETQRVILDPKVNWYFFKIQKIWNRYVYVVTKFFKWKLIDIITEKVSYHCEEKWNDDVAISKEQEILTSFSAEFGQSLTPHTQNFYYSKKQKKSTLKDIESLSDNLLENYIAKTSFEKENVMNDLLTELQNRYHIKNFPYHIECIDISHLSGWRTSGWLSCFLGGLPYKYGYRKYKVQEGVPSLTREGKTKDGFATHPKGKNSNDYAALREVILRRFKSMQEGVSPATKKSPDVSWNKGRKQEGFVHKDGQNLPHLFILDGGKWQLSIISKIKQEFLSQKNSPHRQKLFQNTTFISLGKWAARKRSAKSSGAHEKVFYFDKKEVIRSQKLRYDQVDRILTHIRDEAHRFANNYRKKQMSDERK